MDLNVRAELINAILRDSLFPQYIFIKKAILNICNNIIKITASNVRYARILAKNASIEINNGIVNVQISKIKGDVSTLDLPVFVKLLKNSNVNIRKASSNLEFVEISLTKGKLKKLKIKGIVNQGLASYKNLHLKGQNLKIRVNLPVILVDDGNLQIENTNIRIQNSKVNIKDKLAHIEVTSVDPNQLVLLLQNKFKIALPFEINNPSNLQLNMDYNLKNKELYIKNVTLQNKRTKISGTFEVTKKSLTGLLRLETPQKTRIKIEKKENTLYLTSKGLLKIDALKELINFKNKIIKRLSGSIKSDVSMQVDLKNSIPYNFSGNIILNTFRINGTKVNGQIRGLGEKLIIGLWR